MSTEDQLGKGILVPTTERLLKVISHISIYYWVFRLMRRLGRWSDDELIPLWFAEVYVMGWLVLEVFGYIFVPLNGLIWKILLYLITYRLIDLAQGLASIFVFEPQRRRDDSGGYILVRHPIRWMLLIFLNVAEIVTGFSYYYLTYWREFSLKPATKLSAFYQSFATFVVGSGPSPRTDIGRLITIADLCYFVLILIVVAPVVLSLFRAREYTSQELGQTEEPDKRL